MTMKIYKLFICCCIALSISVTMACPKCNDRGYVYENKECPLCEGYGTVSPAYYGKAVGVTRWTVTESFIGAAKIGEWESEKKYKKYTFAKCPVCTNSKFPGKIKSAKECDCGKDLKKLNTQNYNIFLRMLSKENAASLKAGDNFPKPGEFFWTRLFVEKGNWKMDSKNKQSLLCQAIADKWDVEDARYGRDKQTDK